MDFDQLYKEQFQVVYRYLAGLCGNQALAERIDSGDLLPRH